MVQIETTQLTTECSEWRQILRNHREDLQECQKSLVSFCKTTLDKEQQAQVEHFQNQFDIQLRNIHDLKQKIKNHEKKIRFEVTPDETITSHEALLSDFISLENTLLQLREDYKNFVNQSAC